MKNNLKKITLLAFLSLLQQELNSSSAYWTNGFKMARAAQMAGGAVFGLGAVAGLTAGAIAWNVGLPIALWASLGHVYHRKELNMLRTADRKMQKENILRELYAIKDERDLHSVTESDINALNEIENKIVEATKSLPDSWFIYSEKEHKKFTKTIEELNNELTLIKSEVLRKELKSPQEISKIKEMKNKKDIEKAAKAEIKQEKIVDKHDEYLSKTIKYGALIVAGLSATAYLLSYLFSDDFEKNTEAFMYNMKKQIHQIDKYLEESIKIKKNETTNAIIKDNLLKINQLFIQAEILFLEFKKQKDISSNKKNQAEYKKHINTVIQEITYLSEKVNEIMRSQLR